MRIVFTFFQCSHNIIEVILMLRLGFVAQSHTAAATHQPVTALRSACRTFSINLPRLSIMLWLH